MGKFKLKSATSRKYNQQDASSVHITTMESGHSKVSYYRPLLAKESIKVNLQSLVRMSPMVVPTFGNFNLRHSVFFVPYRTIFPQYDKWKSNDKTLFNGLSYNSCYPRVPMPFLVNALINGGFLESEGANASSFDVCASVINSPGTSTSGASMTFNTVYYKWSSTGRFIADILYSLGYNISYNTFLGYFSTSSNTAYASTFNPYTFNTVPYVDFMPLLALAKVYYDHLYLSHYLTTLQISDYFDSSVWASKYKDFRTYFDYIPSGSGTPTGVWDLRSTTGSYGSSNQNASATALVGSLTDWITEFFVQLTSLQSSFWEHSLFTDAWLTPNSVSGITPSTPIFNDGFNLSVSQSSYSNPVAGDGNGNINVNTSGLTTITARTLSPFALRAMQKLSDYVTRYNIGGTRLKDWLLSNFGVYTQDQLIDDSVFIKQIKEPLKIMDVTQTSQSTSSSLLGEQAGKGFGSGLGQFTYSASLDGAIIVVSEIIPSTGYVQGSAFWTRTNNNGSFSYLDTYQPAFDNLGMQALPNQAVLGDFTRIQTLIGVANASQIDNVFGFIPQYAEWKVRKDILSGMFRFSSQNASLGTPALPAGQLGCYHTFRMFPQPNSGSQPKLGLDFLTQDNQFDRIFALAPTDADGNQIYDHFYCLFNFDASISTTKKSIGESIPFFEKSGDDVVVDYNGDI